MIISWSKLDFLICLQSISTAVQHERGPRKGKQKQNTNKESINTPKSTPSAVTPSPPVSTRPTVITPVDLRLKMAPPTPSALILPTLLHGLIGAERVTDAAVIAGRIGESLQEITARLLFSVVTWCKQVAPLRALTVADQLLLVEHAWRDLFVLSLAQWHVPLEVNTVLECGGVQRQTMAPDTLAILLSHIRQLRDVVGRVKALNLDPTEYACLKAIALFKPELRGLRETSIVDELQDQAQFLLAEYERQQIAQAQRYSTRFGKVLLLLPALASVNSAALEKLFFHETVGNVSIERLVVDIYHTENYD